MNMISSANPNIREENFIDLSRHVDCSDIDIESSQVQMKIVDYIHFVSNKHTSNDWKQFLLYVKDIISVWNPEDFKIKGRLPIQLIDDNNRNVKTVINDWTEDIKPLQRTFVNCSDVESSNKDYDQYRDQGVLDMPIKYRGTKIVIPQCLKHNAVIMSLILNAVACELAVKCILEKNANHTLLGMFCNKDLIAKINDTRERISIGLNIKDLDSTIARNRKLYDDYNLYITVHASMVEPGVRQRNEGVHVDGFQGVKYPIKFENDHAYIFVNEGPTSFTDSAYSPPPNYMTNWYEGELGMNSLKNRLKEGVDKRMVMMSGLQLHEAGSIPKDYPKPSVGRFFFRAEFTLKDHNRKGNTINKRLGKFKEYIDRSIENTIGYNNTRTCHGADFGK